MYLVNLAQFKRMTVAGGISLLTLVTFVAGSDRTFGLIAFGFYFGFMAAFALSWVSITFNAKKTDEPETSLNSQTRDAE